MKLLTLSLLTATGSLANYAEQNRDGANYWTSYYKDSTSTFRVPAWVKEDPFKTTQYDSTTKLQKTGDWDKMHASTSLGNGVLQGTTVNVGTRAVAGTSTQAQVDLITAAKLHYGDVSSPHSNPEDGGRKVWDHIRNFWYRDGEIFAMMLDDSANDMMGGGKYQSDGTSTNTKKDVYLSKGDYGTVNEFHHMEYLRDYCSAMGGTLWAPGSQEEYDDLIERNGGVCDQHKMLYEQGKQYDFIQRTEIYLNIHREGYLACPTNTNDPNCPNSYNRRWNSAGNGKTFEGNACGTEYDAGCPNPRNMNDSSVVAGKYASINDYYTTDRYFGNANQYCGNTHDPHHYAKFTRAIDFTGKPDNQCVPGAGDSPFINDQCWQTTNEHRFQKFVRSDATVINQMLDNPTQDKARQKDCVVATCNDAHQVTGVVGDERHKSEWNAEHCNKQMHVGICRMKLTTCEPSVYTCDESWTDTCNDRKVFKENKSKWLSAGISTAVTANGIAVDPSSAIPIAGGAFSRRVMFTNGESKADLEAWRDARQADGGVGYDFTVVDGNNPVVSNAANCGCKCSWKHNNWANWDATTSFTDRPTCADNNAIGCSVSYKNCVDNTKPTGVAIPKPVICGTTAHPDYCYATTVTGGSTCKMSANNWEAAWTSNSALSCTRVNSCCPAYDVTHVGATVTHKTGFNVVNDRYKHGEQITVTCTAGHFIKSISDGTAFGARQNSIVLTAKWDSGNACTQCFPVVNCEEPPCTECPTLSNGYCYKHTTPTSLPASPNTNMDTTGTIAIGETYHCRCNKGFSMERNAKGPSDAALVQYPWATVSCNTGGVWGAVTGMCKPTKCCNPYSVTDANGKLMAIPDKQCVGIGEWITYQCVDGYTGKSFTSVCNSQDPTSSEGDWGVQAFLTEPTNTCKPITCDVSKLGNETNAWDPVIIPNPANNFDCQEAHPHNTWVDAFYANGAGAPTQVSEGALAIFECYDDFSAKIKPNFREIVYDVAMDLKCAKGTKNGECRTKQTSDQWPTSKAGNNDKLVARCVRGEWTEVSHQCMCDDHKFDIPKYFDEQCLVSQILNQNRQQPRSSTPRLVATMVGIIPAVFLNL